MSAHSMLHLLFLFLFIISPAAQAGVEKKKILLKASDLPLSGIPLSAFAKNLSKTRRIVKKNLIDS
jgi:hypothetical protein